MLAPSARADFDSATVPVAGGGGRADPRGLDRFGVERALRHRVLPMQPAGAVTPVACPDRRAFAALEPTLMAAFGPVACRLKPAAAIEAEIVRLRGANLARRAETRTDAAVSCRGWSGQRAAARIALALAVAGAVALALPRLAVLALTTLTVLALVSVTLLRLAGALVELRHARGQGRTWSSQRPRRILPDRLPVISLLVPLFEEEDIAGHLVQRLSRLDYPRARLEVILILEAGDRTTSAALARARLPDWMRIVAVPPGTPRTKPRAMNYALDFARGEIVGIYDAEDKPARDQLMKVAEGFARAGPEVACLQGVLDFYNARATWLTRLFAIDYAAWFRLVLPGLVRLGIVIPLGGTTVFFRRHALETLGRWDAHNVTEDADLGVRLARRGYRCAFVASVTEEEATATTGAWIRQRSRWIKGYAVTWAVHMRDPLRLFGDLGAWRFLGFQVLFLGTLGQFLLAPFLWSFWLILFGLPHPVTAALPWGAVVLVAALFFFCEVATLSVLALAVATPKHSWLVKWVPAMHLYFPLAAIAFWKGIAELVRSPFWWDKTRHGIGTIRRSGRRAAPRRRHPGAAAPRTPG